MNKTAVVLFNLGGPDSLDAIKPFLLNLFNDPAILPPPQPIRALLARYITYKRLAEAREIYEQLGGSSPLLVNTEAQATALANYCRDDQELSVFLAMRYWHPRAAEAAQAVRAYAPDRIVLLPLYPQFSTTTTLSSLQEWNDIARRTGLRAPTRTICCYPTDTGFVDAVAEMTIEAVKSVAEAGTPRILFSAHGLPVRVITRGDPYQWQIEQSAAAVVEKMKAVDPNLPPFEWLVSYQSRATREPWLGPDTEDEVIRAGADTVPLVVVPIAFVSEHSETLVELDRQYADLARDRGVPRFHRVPTVGAHPRFIDGLAKLIKLAAAEGPPIANSDAKRICPGCFAACPYGPA